MTSAVKIAADVKDDVAIDRPARSPMPRLVRWVFIIAVCAVLAGGDDYLEYTILSRCNLRL